MARVNQSTKSTSLNMPLFFSSLEYVNITLSKVLIKFKLEYVYEIKWNLGPKVKRKRKWIYID